MTPQPTSQRRAQDSGGSPVFQGGRRRGSPLGQAFRRQNRAEQTAGRHELCLSDCGTRRTQLPNLCRLPSADEGEPGSLHLSATLPSLLKEVGSEGRRGVEREKKRQKDSLQSHARLRSSGDALCPTQGSHDGRLGTRASVWLPDFPSRCETPKQLGPSRTPPSLRVPSLESLCPSLGKRQETQRQIFETETPQVGGGLHVLLSSPAPEVSGAHFLPPWASI